MQCIICDLCLGHCRCPFVASHVCHCVYICSFTKIVNKGMTKAEMILKVILDFRFTKILLIPN